MMTVPTTIQEEHDERKEELGGLGGLDLDTAKLDDMSEALRKLELEKRGLLENIRVLRVRLAEEKADQSDVYYYLHKKLDDNYDVISALERQLMVETADREKAETEYASQIEELEIRRDEELGALKEQIIAEEEQLNSMHEVAKNKREADATRARLEAEIISTASMVENDLNTERRKKLQEKQRGRKQVEDEITALSSELFSKKEIELADKTVRAKDNNEKLHAALQAKAKQAERMMVTNQGLAVENRSLRNDADLAKASEVVLDADVRLYHELVVNLKAQLENQAGGAEEEDSQDDHKLVEIDESQDSRDGGSDGDGSSADIQAGIGGVGGKGDDTVSRLETLSLVSDNPASAQIIWAGGACGAIAYESVDELRVAVESLQRLHTELQEEAKKLTTRLEESRAADADADADSASGTFGGGDGGGDRGERDPVVSCLLNAAEKWMTLPTRETPGDEEEEQDQYRAGGATSYLRSLPASAAGQREDGDGRITYMSSGHREILKSDRTNELESQGRGGSSSGKRCRSIRIRSTPRTGGVAPQQGLSPLQNQPNRQAVSTAAVEILGGALAEAAKTPRRRRELFYYLVNAFRDHQIRQTNRRSTVDGGGAGVAEEGSVEERGRGRGGVARISSLARGGSGNLGVGGYDGAPSSDNLSVSVRTLCDFGPPERRNASTQTFAKHFPEKFASVRPARRLVVNNTFLTSSSTVANNSVASASTVRSWGYGTLSLNGQPDRRF